MKKMWVFLTQRVCQTRKCEGLYLANLQKQLSFMVSGGDLTDIWNAIYSGTPASYRKVHLTELDELLWNCHCNEVSHSKNMHPLACKYVCDGVQISIVVITKDSFSSMSSYFPVKHMLSP